MKTIDVVWPVRSASL